MVSVAPQWLLAKLLLSAAGRCHRHPHHHTGGRAASPTVWDLQLLRRSDRAYYFFKPYSGRSKSSVLEGKTMHILGWIVFGLVAGAIARLLMPGRQPMGIILTIVLGIIGSFVGGVIGNAFHGAPLTEPQPSGWIGSIVGALLVLIVYSMVSNRRTTV
jgi:uncharacterized membrane protein YeaQ/YmgE (transglycosylase-associated protein family)